MSSTKRPWLSFGFYLPPQNFYLLPQVCPWLSFVFRLPLCSPPSRPVHLWGVVEASGGSVEEKIICFLLVFSGLCEFCGGCRQKRESLGDTRARGQSTGTPFSPTSCSSLPRAVVALGARFSCEARRKIYEARKTSCVGSRWFVGGGSGRAMLSPTFWSGLLRRQTSTTSPMDVVLVKMEWEREDLLPSAVVVKLLASAINVGFATNRIWAELHGCFLS